MPDNPPSQPYTKYWGKADKACLTSLINIGDVNIYDNSLQNIEIVWWEYFPHRDLKNFRQNFRNFAAAWALESGYAGVRLGE
jgi:hypothetical protein